VDINASDDRTASNFRAKDTICKQATTVNQTHEVIINTPVLLYAVSNPSVYGLSTDICTVCTN